MIWWIQALLARMGAAALLATLTALLYGCGGGGGSSTTNGTPTYVNSGRLPQIQLSAEPVRVVSGQPATLTWSSTDATECVASGGWSGSQPLTGSVEVSDSRPGPATYRLDCSGPRGSASASVVLWMLAPVAAAGGNVQTVTLDRGPAGDAFNAPFVSVTVCTPGTTNCVTVNRVLVDTASVGLRLLSSALPPGAPLPPVQTEAGVPVAACGQFVSGYTWGSVRRADVRLGGGTAAAIPIQVVADPTALYSTVPAPCRATGFNQGSVAGLGANGILGIGMASHDCLTRCTASTSPRLYYTCTALGCTGALMPLDLQLTNPVLYLAGNNNGFLLTLSPVPLSGVTALRGTLTYGIGTQGNNRLGSQQLLRTDGRGRFSTVYKGRTYQSAFIDSGSNGIFFDDAALFACGDFYCPVAPLFLSASNVGSDGAGIATSLIVDSINNFNNRTVALHAAGPYGLSQTFDWGAPFFFGRTVYMALDGAATPIGTGPYWAY